MSSPKYDIRANPPYQVEFAAITKGKHVSATKRRVVFKFGFSSAKAIAGGKTGTDCRGEEHEVTMTWSLTSGKRTVMADNEEVHFSQGRRTETRFETSWQMRGNHIIQLIAHAVAPLNASVRQFDLLIDGLSFFNMPRIFELGVVSTNHILNGGSQPRIAATSHYNTPGSNMKFAQPTQRYELGYPEEKTSYYPQARPSYHHRNSLPVDHSPPLPRQETPPRGASGPFDLMSAPTCGVQDHISGPTALIDQPAPFPVQVPPPPQPQMVTPVMTPVIAPSTAPAVPVVTSVPAPQGVVDEFTPVPPPPPTFQNVADSILNAYGDTTPSLPALTNEPHNDVSFASLNNSFASTDTPHGASPAPLYADPCQSPVSVLEQQGEVSQLQKGILNLVNLDDINEPAEGPLKVTMAKQELKSLQGRNKKTRGLPPLTPAWHLGTNATLADIQAHATPRAEPSSDVMRMHAFDPAAAQAGALVVYRAPSTSGPPPIQRPVYPYGHTHYM